MPVKFAGIKRFEYRWPDGSKERYNAIAYDVTFFGLRHKVLVCFTTREAFGRKRRRVVIFVDEWPEAEYKGCAFRIFWVARLRSFKLHK